jgi:uncharacterized protein
MRVMETVEFWAGERKILGSIFLPNAVLPARPRRKCPGLLFVHGFKSDQSGYKIRARTVAHELGILCLTFDLSGHGAHGYTIDLDSLTPRDHMADVTAAYDELARNSMVDSSRIGVCAASYGAYLASLLTRHRSVSQLLLRAPAMYSDDEYDLPLGVARYSRADPSASLLTTSLRTFGGDVLLLESGADEIIPHDVIEVYLRTCTQAQLVTIPEATHVLTKPEWKEQFLQEILAFFRQL